MYGLKEAAVLAYDQLAKFMKQYGYTHVPGTSGVWTHHTKPTSFCLCVDDIAVKYYNKADCDHLIQAFSNHYAIHIDHSGSHYMGIKLQWHYDKGYVDLSLPNYISNLLQRLQHQKPTRPQYSPHDHQPFNFHNRKQRQLATKIDIYHILK